MLCSYKRYHAAKELELIRKSNLGSFYNYVNKKLNSRSDIPDICDKNGNLCTDNSAKCTVFNHFYASVFTNDDSTTRTLSPRVNTAHVHLGSVTFTPAVVRTTPVSYTHLTLPTKRIV